MELGSIGRNLVVAHRRSILRCSPEQLRFATSEESTLAEVPEGEKGQFPICGSLNGVKAS